MTANTSRRSKTALIIMMVCIPVSLCFEFVSSVSLFERLTLPDRWAVEEIGPVTLRGKSEPLELVAFA